MHNVVDAVTAGNKDGVLEQKPTTALYWPVYFDINERIYTDLPKAGIDFPFPQLDVHLDKQQ